MEQELCRPEVAADFQAAHRISLELEAEQANLEALYEKWMRLMEECDAFASMEDA